MSAKQEFRFKPGDWVVCDDGCVGRITKGRISGFGPLYAIYWRSAQRTGKAAYLAKKRNAEDGGKSWKWYEDHLEPLSVVEQLATLEDQ